jgi:hypothetical protein
MLEGNMDWPMRPHFFKKGMGSFCVDGSDRKYMKKRAAVSAAAIVLMISLISVSGCSG